MKKSAPFNVAGAELSPFLTHTDWPLLFSKQQKNNAAQIYFLKNIGKLHLQFRKNLRKQNSKFVTHFNYSE